MGNIDWDDVYDEIDGESRGADPGEDDFFRGVIENIIVPASATLCSAAYFQAVEGLRISLAATIPLYNLMLSSKKVDTKADKEQLKKLVTESFDSVFEGVAESQYEETMAQVAEWKGNAESYKIYNKDKNVLKSEIERRENAAKEASYKARDIILKGIDEGYINLSEVTNTLNKELRLFKTENIHFEAVSAMFQSFEDFREKIKKTNKKKSRLSPVVADMVAKTKEFKTPESFYNANKAKDARVESKDVIIVASYTRPDKEEVEAVACNNMFPAYMEVSGQISDGDLSSFLEEWEGEV